MRNVMTVKLVMAGRKVLVSACFLFLAFAAAAAADDQTRLDELLKQTYGARLPTPAGDGPPGASVFIDNYGVLAAGAETKRLEEEADKHVFNNSTLSTLNTRMAALEAKSKSPGVTEAEGGIGGGNRGVGWYCNKITELSAALPARVQGLSNNASDYISQLRSIQVGRDDSAVKLNDLAARFGEAIRAWQSHPSTKSLDKDMDDVAANLSRVLKSSTGLGSSGTSAMESANQLKTEAISLYRIGDRLPPLIDLYVPARASLIAELGRLELDSIADIQKRDSALSALQQSHVPKTTSANWRTIIQSPAQEREKLADQSLARIQALTASLGSENSACGGLSDPKGTFDELLQNTRKQIDVLNQSVSSAFAERSIAIQNLDKEHADLIAKNEQEAADLGTRIVNAEARYDAMAPGPDRDRLYNNIVKARELGAAASQSAMNLRLARQGLQAELDSTRNASTGIIGELKGSMSFLLSIGSN